MMSDQYRKYLQSLYDYPECVDAYFDNFEVVILGEDAVAKISTWAQKYVEAKINETQYKIDPNRMLQRAITGYCGEYAVQEFLGRNFIDWSIGNSEKYNKADLHSLGIDCGIKTVEYGKFPLVFKKPKSAEFMVIKKSDYEFWLCGWADPQILGQHQCEDLILDPKLRQRGVKTAFYGFEHLIDPFFLKLIYELDLEQI
jgi:hypothetical protein